MKCEKCGNDASISVRAVVNGYVHDFYLCEDCLKKYTNMDMTNTGKSKQVVNKIDFDKLNLGDLIENFIPSLDNMIDSYYDFKFNLNNKTFDYLKSINQRTCPSCGNPESNIKVGKFGCNQCYKLNHKLTEKILKSFNNFDTYRGDFPKAEREFKEVALEIKSLQEKLNQSVETEDYEQAQILKERIDDLNMKVQNW